MIECTIYFDLISNEDVNPEDFPKEVQNLIHNNRIYGEVDFHKIKENRLQTLINKIINEFKKYKMTGVLSYVIKDENMVFEVVRLTTNPLNETSKTFSDTENMVKQDQVNNKYGEIVEYYFNSGNIVDVKKKEIRLV